MASIQTTARQQRRKSRGNGEGAIYKRTEKRQKADGRVELVERWCASVSFEGGTRQVLYGRTRQEVAQKLSAALKRRTEGLRPDTGRLTVGAWLDQWLDELIRPRYDAATGQQTSGREPTTYASYEILVRRHLKPRLGTKTLARLQPEDVARWQRTLEDLGASAETRRAALVRLRTALNVAMQRNHVGRNVAMLVEGPRQPRAKYQLPETSDLLRLLATVQHDRLKALVYLGLGLGLRRAEIVGLRWQDVDLEQRIITVRTRVNRIGKAFGLLVRPGLKSQEERRILMPRLVADALRAQRTYQLEDRLAAGPKWKGPGASEEKAGGFVFTSGVGTLLEPRKVNVYFADVRRRAGLDAHRFHGLRHDFASLLLAAGVPTRVVQEMLGHSNPAFTMHRYQHVPDALQRVAAEQLDALLTPAAAG